MQKTFMLFSLAVLIGLAFVTTSFTRSITDMSKPSMYAQAQSPSDTQQSRGSDMQNREGQPAVPGGAQGQGGMQSAGQEMKGGDIFATLEREHREVSQLVSQLKSASDQTTRRDVLKQLNIALYPHMKAEEQTLYESMKDNKANEEIAKQAQEEHDRIAEALNEVNDSINKTSFNANVAKLEQLISSHVKREESQLFTAAKKMDQTKLSEISANYETEKQKVAQETEQKQYENGRAADTDRRTPGTATGVTGGTGNGTGTRDR